ncbi:MAG: Rpn family recombination-promoting nuclease/putative transposase [Blastocatellia bacterium]
MAYDNICKYLAEKFPREMAAWATGRTLAEVAEAEVLKTELGVEPIRADAAILLRLIGAILHLEFQTTPQSRPPLPLRMLDYWVRFFRLYSLPVTQVVVVLSETDEEIPTEFRAPNTWHRYQVIKLWEVEADALLQSPALLPLAVLARSDQPRQLLQLVAEEIERVEPEEIRIEVNACTQVMAGLRFDRNLIRGLFREEIMQESVIYNEIIERGIQQGIQRGLQQGIEQGLQQGIEQGEKKIALEIVLRQLKRRFGAVDEVQEARLSALSVPQLEQLGEDLLGFQSPADLADWLQRNAE